MKLTKLNCNNNKISKLNLGNSINLKELECISNQINTLDVYAITCLFN